MGSYKYYLLDSHIVVWLAQNSPRLPRKLREDIEYFQGDFAVSMESLKEIAHKVALNKIDLGTSFRNFIKLLAIHNITPMSFEAPMLFALVDLPLVGNNPDPTDRAIIASAIASNRILISADQKFPAYRKHGLNLVEI